MTTPSYTDYQTYFEGVSDAILAAWIDTTERRLPNFRRFDDIVAAKIGLLAAKDVQKKRVKNS